MSSISNHCPIHQRQCDCCNHNQGLPKVHARDEDNAENHPQGGKEISRRQFEHRTFRLPPPQHGERCAADAVIQKTGYGGERYIPFEFTDQRKTPNQDRKNENRDIRRVEAPMQSGKGFGEIPLLGLSEEHAWHGENLRAEVSVERDQRADGNQRRA